ncbi:MAG TPA: tetratricopeptide repeat protein [Smithellaceae bacterium]|nr:tetratricopeptide repeat protein [Smithellaceae bacterium]
MRSKIFIINLRIIVLFVLFCVPVMAHGAVTFPLRSDLNRGNDLYKKGEYSQAGQIYNKILEKKANDQKAKFNLGDSLYKEGRYKESQGIFKELAEKAVDKNLREKAFYNLGNSFFKQEDYKSAISAYEGALKIDPKDKDAQFNLELAKKMLTMPKQQKDKQKDKDKEKQQNKNDEKNKSGNKPEDKDKDKNKDNKEENKDKDKGKEQDQQKQPKPGQMSKEDALRLLNALEDQEKHKTQKMKAGRGRGDVKDW